MEINKVFICGMMPRLIAKISSPQNKIALTLKNTVTNVPECAYLRYKKGSNILRIEATCTKCGSYVEFYTDAKLEKGKEVKGPLCIDCGNQKVIID